MTPSETCLSGFDVWSFSARSLLRPYGKMFLQSVVLRHPFRFLSGLREYRLRTRPARSMDHAMVGISSWDGLAAEAIGGEWVVGMGFCQKPIEPPCPSGRFNHRCWFLTRAEGSALPPACRACQVRDIAERALPAGAALYAMTSAADIASDLLLPVLRSGVPRLSLLSVCPYSVPPLTLAMTICGLRGIVQSYSEGDCRDFATWLRADEGDKREQTHLPPAAHTRLLDFLDRVAAARREQPRRYTQQGNLYVPAR
ncbi:MAG: hypothetical protein ACE141_08985 [Bryobacteraceae bacterium]